MQRIKTIVGGSYAGNASVNRGWGSLDTCQTQDLDGQAGSQKAGEATLRVPDHRGWPDAEHGESQAVEPVQLALNSRPGLNERRQLNAEAGQV